MPQKITYQDKGSRVERVLELLTPVTGIVAPAAHAKFIGQIYVDTVAKKGYMAVATDSEVAANDWEQVTFVV